MNTFLKNPYKPTGGIKAQSTRDRPGFPFRLSWRMVSSRPAEWQAGRDTLFTPADFTVAGQL